MSEEAAPLLLPAAGKVHHHGCPGCAQERKLEMSKGIPYREFFFVGVTTLASSLPITFLFPFLYFMVRDMKVAKSEEDIGLYAGFLECYHQFSGVWLLIGMDGGLLSSLPYFLSLTTRILLGVLNGLLAPMKAYCIEVCRTEHQALGLSVVHTAWGMGLVIGPALGGYLAQPADKYPHYFSKMSAFGRFPYLLPSLVVSLFAAIVLVACIWLPETIHKHNCFESNANSVNPLVSQDNVSSSTQNKSLIKNWPWISAMISFSIFCLHDTAYGEVIPLWAVSDKKHGGLSFSSDDVGQVLAVADRVVSSVSLT